jgi:hypothetical protein
VRAIVANAIGSVAAFEVANRVRKYRRSAERQQLFEAIIESLVCDAMHHEIEEPGWGVTVTQSRRLLGRKDRYGSAVLSETLPEIIERLTATEWLTFSKGHLGYEGIAKKRRSTIGAGPRLLEAIERDEVRLEDFTRRPGEEVIILKAKKRHAIEESKAIDYQDDRQTDTFRREVRLINEWLEAADLGCREDRLSEGGIDTGNRRLRRYFNNGRFDLGGRLFGGFWQGNDRSGMTRERRRGVTIDGCPTAEVDFAQNSLRIAY